MNHSVKIINRTVECENEDPYKLREDMCIIAGKAAGICYMDDNYLSEGIMDTEKALKRANMTAKSGHYSTYEHGHISFLIETSKIMAMVLNSLNLYSTSEKSGRYTTFTGESELEISMYNKWKSKFTRLIDICYSGRYTEKEVEKLSIENARYMISVFSPTVLEYTVPYNRAVLTVEWLRNLASSLDYLIKNEKEADHGNSVYKKYDYFYNKLSTQCRELSYSLASSLGVSEEDPLLTDHKNMGIELLRTPIYISKLYNIYNDSLENAYDKSKKTEVYGDVYTSNYKASLAIFAQEQRHRTLHYTMDLPKELDVYVPKILRQTAFKVEWRKDYETLINSGIIPQGTLVDVTEEGRFEDFYLKCKERLCSRAQLEIVEITRNQVVKFANEYDNLCEMNKGIIDSMIRTSNILDYKNSDTIIVEPRCRFFDYICREPCKMHKNNINYFRII